MSSLIIQLVKLNEFINMKTFAKYKMHYRYKELNVRGCSY